MRAVGLARRCHFVYPEVRMYPAVRSILIVYAALFPIVNPLAMAPVFAALTNDYAVRVRRTIATRVAVNGIMLLMTSLFFGSYVLDFFGISIGAVELGGGLLVVVAGWRILNQQSDVSERHLDAPPSTETAFSQAFYPLTMPLTVGPGSIAVALTLGSNLHAETHLKLMATALFSTVGIVLIGVTIFLCYGFSDALERLLGPTGTNIVIRLSGFILVCIGIQIMFNGANQFYAEMVHNANVLANPR